MIAPSGDQIELVLGEQRAVVVEVGGGLRTYTVGDRDVLDGYPAYGMATSARGQVLAPWPNRIEDGRYEFAGQTHQLPLDEPALRNAIHGLVRWVPWRVGEREAHRVVVEHTLHPQPGYPFSLALLVEYSLSDDGLRATTTATNAGAGACPFGCGAHPYLGAGSERVDDALLGIPAGAVLRPDERSLPLGAEPVAAAGLDFRSPRPVGTTVLDHCFADLEREPDGRARVLLERPDGLDVTLWADESYGYLMVFTGDPLPDVARRSLAVEPMTCPPNAFRSGEGLVVLEPGESWTGSWGIATASG